MRSVAVLTLILAVAACSGADEATSAPPLGPEDDPAHAEETPSFPSLNVDAAVPTPSPPLGGGDGGDAAADGPTAPVACLAAISALGIRYRRTAARGVIDAVILEGPVGGVLFATGTDTKPMGEPVACAFVQTLHGFAMLLTERGFARVGTLGSYCYRCCCSWSATNTCRTLTDPEPVCPSGYSNHSWGRALDVRYLYKSDGRRFDINANTDYAKFKNADTCGAGLTAQVGASRELYALACEAGARRLFETILIPNYNDIHRNHFHMDIGERGLPGTVTVRSVVSRAVVDDAVNGRCDE